MTVLRCQQTDLYNWIYKFLFLNIFLHYIEILHSLMHCTEVTNQSDTFTSHILVLHAHSNVWGSI